MPKKPKTKNKELYFIALVLPEEGANRATAIKEYFQAHYGSKAALRSPPHITLHMPFTWPDKKVGQLQRFLATIAGEREAMELTLQNFNAFPPRVIYIDVLPSLKLNSLQGFLLDRAKSELKLFNSNYKSRPFVPHLTVAFRDLKKADFHEAWKVFASKEFHYQFLARELSLLQHDGKAWQVFNSFPLGLS